MAKRILSAVLALLIAASSVQAKVSLPSFFSDNMVLQQQADVAIWGTTDKGAVKVTVRPSWTRKKYSAVADERGKWFLRIPTPAAGGPYRLVFSDGEKTVLENVLLGEVWYCSGQSNMEMPMKGFRSQPVQGSTEIIVSAKASTPIRMCTIERKASLVPLDSAAGGSWKENTPAAVANTSAVAYFFAMRVQSVLVVPVGILISEWGGTPIETWINRETFEKEFGDEYDLSFLDRDTLPEKPDKQPCTLFNGQVAPLIPFTFKGMLWYQGEANRREPELYTRLQPAYVRMMRSLFQNPDAPFYFVQTAPWKSKHPENITIPVFNEAQEKTLSLIPNSGMASTVDIGEYGTIHPCRKKEVGDRLALLALTKTYGIQATAPGSSSYKETVGIDAESPSFKEAVFKDGKAIVTMNVGKMGLSPLGQDLEGFELAGVDGVFHPATGTVEDRYFVEVTSPEVPYPVAVRYCFHNWTRGTLYNCFGIPALPFRSDKPSERVTVCGEIRPDRKDDLIWENEYSGYRAFGPALQAKGEQAFGYDIFTKSVTDPVLHDRYEKALGPEKISFHLDHGDGMDSYGVGPTLGCGTAALVDDSGIVYPWCWKEAEILENGPRRFRVKLTYPPVVVRGKEVIEHREITLESGKRMNRVDITYDGLDAPCPIVVGIVVHAENPDGWFADNSVLATADLGDRNVGQNGEMYCGAVFPGGFESFGFEPFAQPAGQAIGHVLGHSTYYPGSTFTYYFGSGWSKAGINGLDEWIKIIR